MQKSKLVTALSFASLLALCAGLAFAADGDKLTSQFTVINENPQSWTQSVKSRDTSTDRNWIIGNTVCNNTNGAMTYTWSIDGNKSDSGGLALGGPGGKRSWTVNCIGEPAQSSGGQLSVSVVVQ